MLATDIDAHSLKCARENLKANNLTEHVSVFQVEPEGARFPTEAIASVDRCVFFAAPSAPVTDRQAHSVDFTMCNPPFYASQSEIDESLAAKELEPFAVRSASRDRLRDASYLTRILHRPAPAPRAR